MKPPPKPERRNSVLRRQFNESFCSPDGTLSITKTVAIAAQIVLLYHLGRDFDTLVLNFESFLAVLAFLIAPDTFKKLIAMKYGGSHA